MTSEPFDPPYTAEDLPELDRRHILVGLGVEWLVSEERAKILGTRLADAGTTQSAPEPSQAATEAHGDDERVRKYLAEKDAEIARLTSERDAAQEHVAYHLRDYALNSDLTGDLAVDMAAYAGRLKIRAEAAEAKVARVEARHVDDGSGYCAACPSLTLWPEECHTRAALDGDA